MIFPAFRKYKNSKSFFKIISENEVHELKLVGKKYILFTITSQQLPERNMIHDMIYDYEGNWDLITEEEFKVIESTSGDYPPINWSTFND
ncbi:MAG TPA: hypothetical protein VF691_18600 [Cytophagaceae bacterium]|jgi:hypothetical protein